MSQSWVDSDSQDGTSVPPHGGVCRGEFKRLVGGLSGLVDASVRIAQLSGRIRALTSHLSGIRAFRCQLGRHLVSNLTTRGSDWLAPSYNPESRAGAGSTKRRRTCK